MASNTKHPLQTNYEKAFVKKRPAKHDFPAVHDSEQKGKHSADHVKDDHQTEVFASEQQRNNADHNGKVTLRNDDIRVFLHAVDTLQQGIEIIP